jgi:EAL and modified HD-GYP domain-containing signal transduction protein
VPKNDLMSATGAASDVMIARQPVYDPALRVVGYELLVQRRDGSSAGDDADASSTISELGLNLVTGHPAYIRVSRPLLLEDYASALPADRVVLEVGPELALDKAAQDKVEELVADGYDLALVDLEPGAPAERLLPFAKVVGVDVQAIDRAVLRSELGHLREYGARLMARNVAEQEHFELCSEFGFDLLQGYFFCQPRVVAESGVVPVNKLARVQMLGELQAPDVDFDGLVEIIGRDVGLSYNLLRFINSAFFALPRRVDSLRDALVLLGVENVRKWATLMAMADADDKPRELVVTAIVRARMCEQLAVAYQHKDVDGFFTTGLFSVVDALMDTSLVELLASLPLSREIIEALLNYEGAKGRVLRAVIAYERGAFAELGELPPTRTPLADIYADSVAWATETLGTLT